MKCFLSVISDGVNPEIETVEIATLCRERELQVVKRKNLWRSWEFREKAAERMKSGETTRALAKELGVHRSVLYRWRDRLAAVEATATAKDEGLASGSREGRLYRENNELKQALAERVMEVDFFKGALQKVAARRQSTGARASTTKSGK
jgi:hypothetical protein